MELLHYLTVFSLSALKYMVGVVAGVGMRLPFWAQFGCTALGGVLGVAAYTYLGDRVRRWLQRRRARRVAQRALQQPAAPPPQPPRVAPWLRKLWRVAGMPGLALITPPLLGPPVGIPIALALGEPRWRILLYVGVTVVAWSYAFAAFSTAPWIARLLD